MTTNIDVLVIGSGQAGGPLASAFAEAGKTTVLVERDNVGGTCVNVGCTPTKTMIASGDVAWTARRGGEYGVKTGNISRSEEHTSELQSRENLVCRLLLAKKKSRLALP